MFTPGENVVTAKERKIKGERLVGINLEPLPGSQPERRLLYFHSMRAER